MFDDIEFDIKEYPIKGKMVIGSVKVSLSEMMTHSDAKINQLVKEKLTKDMVNFILENKLAEFTMQESHTDMTKFYRIRCFLTSDEQVRLIRKLYDEKK